MKTPRRLSLFLVGSLCLASSAHAEHMMALQNQAPRDLAHVAKLERVAASEPITLGLVVKLDQDLLDQTLQPLMIHHAGDRKHYLSAGEFTQRFGLSEKRELLKSYAQANGLTVDADDHPESMIVRVSGTADTVEHAFRVQLHKYRDADGKIFRSHDSDPMIPTSLAANLGCIVGLSNRAGLRKTHHAFKPIAANAVDGSRRAAAPSPDAIAGGTGPGGTLSPTDIKTIYGLNSLALDGTGQEVALYELDGFYAGDITAYENQFHLPTIPIGIIGVDGASNLCHGANCATSNPTSDPDMVEVELDIEMVAALSPGIARLDVYEAPNTEQGALDLFDRIATDNLASVVSTSWGESETLIPLVDLNTENQIFQRMALQGQSLYAASGDNGAHDGQSVDTADDPAAQPLVTGVGGTVLTGSVAGPSESSWNDSSGASGGAVSVVWATPSYQDGVPGTASQVKRNVPDVSLNASPSSGYAIIVAGTWYFGGGTSAAAPLWAAFTALLNQQNATLGVGHVGFANPILYSEGTSADYHTLFNDITTGNNNGFSAGPGYDNVTGLGSFKGAALIGAISGQQPIAPPVTVVPTLNNVYAFPNPWDARKPHPDGVMIKNLPDGARVKIFTISGFYLADFTASGGSVVWDLKNSAGKSVASGLYLYTVEYNSKIFRGKIAVIK